MIYRSSPGFTPRALCDTQENERARSGGNEMEELISKLTTLDERINEIQVRL
jgi:hypothetical protein